MGWQDAPAVETGSSWQSAPAVEDSTMAGEAARAVGRGVLSLPNLVFSAGDWLESKLGSPGQVQQRQINIPEWLRPPGFDPRANLQASNEQLRAQPANNAQRMVGTGLEIGTSAMFGGGAMSAGKRIAGAAVPAAGGVVGEQLGGDMGKLIGTLAAPFVQGGVSRILAPKGRADAGAEVRALTEAGVQPTLGQTLGGPFARLEQAPLIRELAHKSKLRANEQFNTAVYNRALSPIQGRVSQIGHEGYNEAHKLASAAYDDALAHAKPIRIDDQKLWEDIDDALQSIANKSWRTELRDVYQSVIKPHRTSARVIPGDKMKDIDSQLGELARRYRRSTMPKDGYVGEAIADMQTAFREAVARQNPEVAVPLRAADTAWRNLLRLENAVVRAKDESGVFTPRELQAAIKATDTTRKKVGYAMGKSPMQDISRAGNKVLGEPTIPPYLWGPPSGLTGMAGKVLAAPLMSIYNPVVQKALPSLFTQRPEWAQAIGGAMRTQGMGQAMAGAAPSYPPLFSQGEQ